jgi:rhomboid family GlyGly-CTERM serine protease
MHRFSLTDRSLERVLPLVLVLVLLALYAGGDAVVARLRYERHAVLAGEWWRLVSAHLVHADFRHLGWNVFGVTLVWALFGRDFNRAEWLLILLASTISTDLGFLVVDRSVGWYLGFSGVLHGCMAAGLVAWLVGARGRDAMTLLVAALFAGKLIWESAVGPLPFAGGSISVPVLHQAHLYGAVGGALAALGILGHRRRRPASL